MVKKIFQRLTDVNETQLTEHFHYRNEQELIDRDKVMSERHGHATHPFLLAENFIMDFVMEPGQDFPQGGH